MCQYISRIFECYHPAERKLRANTRAFGVPPCSRHSWTRMSKHVMHIKCSQEVYICFFCNRSGIIVALNGITWFLTIQRVNFVWYMMVNSTLCSCICVPVLLSVLHVSMTQRYLLEPARCWGFLLHNEHLIFCELFRGKKGYTCYISQCICLFSYYSSFFYESFSDSSMLHQIWLAFLTVFIFFLQMCACWVLQS